jgi:hypothetical protein
MYLFTIIWLCFSLSVVYDGFAFVSWNWFQVHIEFRQQCLEMTVDKLLEQFVLNKYTGLVKPGKCIFLLCVSYFFCITLTCSNQTTIAFWHTMCLCWNFCNFDVCEMLLVYLVLDWEYHFGWLVILGNHYEFFDLILWRFLLGDKMQHSSYTCAANWLCHCLLYMIRCCCMINRYV